MENQIKWTEIIEANREAVENAIKEAFQTAQGMQNGYSVHVEIYENGKIEASINSHNWQSQDSWDGKCFRVATIQAWDYEYNDFENMRSDKNLFDEYQNSKYFYSENSDTNEYYEDDYKKFLEIEHAELLVEWHKEEEMQQLEACYENIDYIIDNAFDLT